jgi:hypothetical protein
VGPFLAAPPETAERSLAESLRLLVMGSWVLVSGGSESADVPAQRSGQGAIGGNGGEDPILGLGCKGMAPGIRKNSTPWRRVLQGACVSPRPCQAREGSGLN